LAHSLPFRFFKSAKNEENMIVKNSWNQCLVIGLIHTIRFNTFNFFDVILFAFEVQKCNIID
jgi:hypothetical protein